MSVADIGPQQETQEASILAKARQNGFWAGILASVIATIIGGAVTSLFPAIWDFISIPRLPSGAVVAFDRMELNESTPCPSGWLPYHDLDGRTIIGVSSSRPYRTPGGSESFKLSEDQLPPHGFSIRFVPDRENLNNGNYDLIRSIVDFSNPSASGTAKTNMIGKGDSISIMPPYRPLFYCIRK